VEQRRPSLQTLEDGGQSGEERIDKTPSRGSTVRHLGRPLATQGSHFLPLINLQG
jgi:hypothetical protein